MLPSISFLVCCIGLVIFKVEGSVVGQEAWVEWSAYKVQNPQVLWHGPAHPVHCGTSVWSVSRHPSSLSQHACQVCLRASIWPTSAHPSGLPQYWDPSHPL